MLIDMGDELALKWLARQHIEEHIAPLSTEFYSWILAMVLQEERAVACIIRLTNKGLIKFHDNKVMHPLYFDEFYNEDFDALDKKYDFRNPETWIGLGEVEAQNVWVSEQSEYSKQRIKEMKAQGKWKGVTSSNE